MNEKYETEYSNNCLTYYHSDDVEKLLKTNEVFFFTDITFDYLVALSYDFKIEIDMAKQV